MKNLGWLLALGGCVTETGNPELEPRDLAALGRSTDPDVAISDEAAGDPGDAGDAEWVVTEAFVTLKEVRFERAEVCDQGGTDEAEVEGPWTVDLVRRSLLPIRLAQTSYCRVRVPLERAEGGDADDRSIQIRGERADGASFLIRSRDTRELEVRSEGAPFTLGPDGVPVLLAFDLGRWLAATDLGGLDPDGNGEILVDDDTNRDALDRFEQAVEDSLGLFEDLDGDLLVDPDDTTLAGG